MSGKRPLRRSSGIKRNRGDSAKRKQHKAAGFLQMIFAEVRRLVRHIQSQKLNHTLIESARLASPPSPRRERRPPPAPLAPIQPLPAAAIRKTRTFARRFPSAGSPPSPHNRITRADRPRAQNRMHKYLIRFSRIKRGAKLLGRRGEAGSAARAASVWA